MTDKQQMDQFREALDEKNRRDQERAEEQAGAASAAANEDQLSDTDENQDSFSVRDKSSRHGKVTADKWNQ